MPSSISLRFAFALSLAMLSLMSPARLPAARRGEIEIEVFDEQTGEPIAVRMHLKNQKGKFQKGGRSVFWKDHFVFSGKKRLKLPPGTYRFEMERGPEYRIQLGNFTLKSGDKDSKQLSMKRFVDMKKEGWWSGELHIHRPLKDIEMLMQAEDLHVGPVITWWNDKNSWADKEIPENLLVKFDTNRFYHLMAGEDEREGGALMYFNLKRPLPIVGAEKEYPSPVVFLRQARQQPGVHIDIEKPFWWDMPVWLSTGMVDSIGLANNHMWRSGVLANEAWGKARDPLLYPGPLGNGRWSQEIYYHILNCGLRIPPSAGSASGVLPNPVGYNRVYVHCGEDFSYQKWWEGLRAGRVVVTNGPLLRPLVEGKLPGHVFQAREGEELELETTLKLSTRDNIEYLEVIKNGGKAFEVRLDDWAEAGGRLPKLKFKRSGWFLIRTVSSNEETYRFASTGPYYVQIGEQTRVSRKSARFFLDWVYERARRLNLPDKQKHKEVLKEHRAARDFWKAILEKANTE